MEILNRLINQLFRNEKQKERPVIHSLDILRFGRCVHSKVLDFLRPPIVDYCVIELKCTQSRHITPQLLLIYVGKVQCTAVVFERDGGRVSSERGERNESPL